MNDIAARAGVSESTVSLVLSGKQSDRITQATQEKVRAIAEDLGYVRNANAAALAGRRRSMVGIVVGGAGSSIMHDPYLQPIFDGIFTVAEEKGQNVAIFSLKTAITDRFSAQPYLGGQCDGLLLVALPRGSGVLEAVTRARVPFVLIHDTVDDPAVSCVDVDDVAAARAAVGFLLARGHRHIAAVGVGDDYGFSRRRLEGYRLALADYGLEYDARLAVPFYRSRVDGAALSTLLARKDRPSALFCFTDGRAVSALEMAAAQGLRVPTDLSVMGFNDTSLAAQSVPALTTMHQPLRDLAAQGTRLLLDLIDGHQPPGQKQTVATHIVVRDSVAPPRAGNAGNAAGHSIDG